MPSGLGPHPPSRHSQEFQIDFHPTILLFPDLDEEDLHALADDIRAKGLLHPIVLDTDGRIIDGRNRLKACTIAGVEPAYTTYDGDDPSAYALSANVHRRNLTKGQIAMITAKACSLSEHGERWPKGRYAPEQGLKKGGGGLKKTQPTIHPALGGGGGWGVVVG
ncbi:ParB/RepB/Spo0J family partition protein, partial [Streptomyces sp. NPDC059129]|uniref:ParB/RepB/Spo0J family partition protein n=2 Tax=unclassified Streptomyces TaxID=2593676 RepID=UPI0036C393C3